MHAAPQTDRSHLIQAIAQSCPEDFDGHREQVSPNSPEFLAMEDYMLRFRNELRGAAR